jgi:ferredoxin-NADP reductase
MDMASYPSRVLGREELCENTMAFHLEKPAGFEFRPGQFVDVSLIDPPETDPQGIVRTFSIASAPSENELLVATRMRNSAFKRVLAKLPAGAPLTLEGPMGSFTLHKNPTKPAAFLAGGIGITPFLSILRDAAKQKLPHHIYLFYSNRSPETAAFLEELQRLESSNPNFHFIPTMVEMSQSKRDWKGATGYINGDLLVKHLKNLSGPIYYIAGPPKMVAAMRKMLTDATVNEDDIRMEEFGGY